MMLLRWSADVLLRVRYSKLGRVRFVSHRDGARLWERALRRVGVPVAYTQGFTPRPKMSFGLALPTGAESVAEYLDLGLTVDTLGKDVKELCAELTSALPAGMAAQYAQQRETSGESLQESVTSTTWVMWNAEFDAAAIDAATERLLAADEILVERERKKKTTVDDVRPLILDLRRDDDRLVADLVTTGRALRPAELAAAAFQSVDSLGVRVLRTHQWISHDGDRREVLSLPADVSAHDEASSA